MNLNVYIIQKPILNFKALKVIESIYEFTKKKK